MCSGLWSGWGIGPCNECLCCIVVCALSFCSLVRQPCIDTTRWPRTRSYTARDYELIKKLKQGKNRPSVIFWSAFHSWLSILISYLFLGKLGALWLNWQHIDEARRSPVLWILSYICIKYISFKETENNIRGVNDPMGGTGLYIWHLNFFFSIFSRCFILPCASNVSVVLGDLKNRDNKLI